MQVEEVAWKEITKFLDELEKVSKKGKREENLKLLNLIILIVSINWGEKVSTLSGFVSPKTTYYRHRDWFAIQKERVQIYIFTIRAPYLT